MKHSIVLGVILLGLTTIVSTVPLTASRDFSWMAYKLVHQKRYSDPVEETKRYNIFKQRVRDINAHNALYDLGFETFSTEINQFTDMTEEEFSNLYLNTFKRERQYNNQFESSEDGILDHIDWREHGLVTPVKNQGQCGSCWAFSTTGSVEGQQKKKNGKLLSLSEQQLVDCATSTGNHGCHGGMMDFAFEYIQKSGGLESEDEYTYNAEENGCHFNGTKVVARISGYVDIQQGDEHQLKKAVSKVGPISVAIDASGWWFMHYKNGIYTNRMCSPVRLNHGVLIVGYGTKKSYFWRRQDYWIVKNSWSPLWGDEGYIKMARNKNNMCGIATMASYPVV